MALTLPRFAVRSSVSDDDIDFTECFEGRGYTSFDACFVRNVDNGGRHLGLTPFCQLRFGRVENLGTTASDENLCAAGYEGFCSCKAETRATSRD